MDNTPAAAPRKSGSYRQNNVGDYAAAIITIKPGDCSKKISCLGRAVVTINTGCGISTVFYLAFLNHSGSGTFAEAIKRAKSSRGKHTSS